jgi:peptide/nickel transport system substrate-binding protein
MKTTNYRKTMLAAAGALGLGLAAFSPAQAVTLKYAFQGDLNALDGYTLNESFTLGALGNVYEGLTKRDKDLKIIPGLAEKWEVVEPTRWRFTLRKGVKFQGGEDFTADDVLFSLDRMRSPDSQVKSRAPADMKAVKVDDHTVDFILTTPNPILNAAWDTWYIMSKKWCEENNATQAMSAKSTSLSAAALKANGTGPFSVVSHEPGVKTVFKKNDKWWGKPEHNLDDVIFTTIKSDATRVAALLSGEVDLIEPVPVQDMERINADAKSMVLSGPELRTIFFNFDSFRDELKYATIKGEPIKGKNPFKDVRVRKAFYMAIDIEAIKSKVMRNTAVPSAILISPLLFSGADAFKRQPLDIDGAKKLMTEAGYADGFDLRMDCPNDRYVNDAAICQAAAAMLSKINVKVTLNAQPKAKFFEFAGPTGKYDSSFNMLGWTPGTMDSHNVLVDIAGCRDADGKGAQFNYGGYCNPKVDALAKQILGESDKAKRDAMIGEAFKILHDEVALLPLHQQSLAWGVSKTVTIPQRADDHILFYWANKK